MVILGLDLDFLLTYALNIFSSKRRERERGPRRSRRSGFGSESSATTSSSTNKFHAAASHDDTSEGALHWFQDENGKQKISLDYLTDLYLCDSSCTV